MCLETQTNSIHQVVGAVCALLGRAEPLCKLGFVPLMKK